MDSENRWIIDTDPGCDDMIAIMYLLKKLKGKIELISLTQGNATYEHVSINIRRILAIMDIDDALIMKGASSPILNTAGYSYHFHKSDGLGNVEEFQILDYERIKITEGYSVTKIVELCKRYPKQINILSIGPLTNLSLAYMICPSIVDDINEIYIMGGTSESLGNSSAMAEANFGFDFISNKIIFDNFRKIFLTHWECTLKTKYSASYLENLKHQKIKENLKIDEKKYNALYKILNVFDSLEICDFYSTVPIFRKDSVKTWYLSIAECIIDSTVNVNGLSIFRNLNHNYDSIEKASEFGGKINKCVIIIDEFHREILDEELCSIFIKEK